MISRKVSAIRELVEALPKDELQKRAMLPIFREVQGTVQTVHDAVKEQVQEQYRRSLAVNGSKCLSFMTIFRI